MCDKSDFTQENTKETGDIDTLTCRDLNPGPWWYMKQMSYQCATVLLLEKFSSQGFLATDSQILRPLT